MCFKLPFCGICISIYIDIWTLLFCRITLFLPSYLLAWNPTRLSSHSLTHYKVCSICSLAYWDFYPVSHSINTKCVPCVHSHAGTFIASLTQSTQSVFHLFTRMLKLLSYVSLNQHKVCSICSLAYWNFYPVSHSINTNCAPFVHSHTETFILCLTQSTQGVFHLFTRIFKLWSYLSLNQYNVCSICSLAYWNCYRVSHSINTKCVPFGHSHTETFILSLTQSKQSVFHLFTRIPTRISCHSLDKHKSWFICSLLYRPV